MSAFIKAISYYLPQEVLSNEDISRNFPEWSTEKIAQKVGIKERHIAGKNETAGDMASFFVHKARITFCLQHRVSFKTNLDLKLILEHLIIIWVVLDIYTD